MTTKEATKINIFLNVDDIINCFVLDSTKINIQTFITISTLIM